MYEAMASGLPVIVTPNVGADLVRMALTVLSCRSGHLGPLLIALTG